MIQWELSGTVAGMEAVVAGWCVTLGVIKNLLLHGSMS